MASEIEEWEIPYTYHNVTLLTSLDSFKRDLLSEWPRMTHGMLKFTSISALSMKWVNFTMVHTKMWKNNVKPVNS
uniref:Uncharacterized protein MANES_01G173500 n=1 Tax=Rhizophora mucronata TaxID=61149 RepID=A0A2P2L2A0_RHIMU